MLAWAGQRPIIAAMNQKVDLGLARWVNMFGLASLRTGWRKWAVIGGAALVAVYVLYRVTVAFVLSDENRPAGEAIVAAVQAYKLANGRFPEKLEQLQPRFLATIPQPAPATNFVYAAASDGATFWFGYQTHRDMFNEYDSSTRKWQYLEYEDSDALRMPRREFVMGPK